MLCYPALLYLTQCVQSSQSAACFMGTPKMQRERWDMEHDGCCKSCQL